MRAEAGVGSVRKGRRSRARRDRFAVVRRRWKAIVAFFGVLLLGVLALGFAYAGSADVVADGVTVSGQDVGGLSAVEAETKTLHAGAGVVIRAGGLHGSRPPLVDRTCAARRPRRLGRRGDRGAGPR